MLVKSGILPNDAWSVVTYRTPRLPEKRPPSASKFALKYPASVSSFTSTVSESATENVPAARISASLSKRMSGQAPEKTSDGRPVEAAQEVIESQLGHPARRVDAAKTGKNRIRNYGCSEQLFERRAVYPTLFHWANFWRSLYLAPNSMLLMPTVPRFQSTSRSTSMRRSEFSPDDGLL